MSTVDSKDFSLLSIAGLIKPDAQNRTNTSGQVGTFAHKRWDLIDKGDHRSSFGLDMKLESQDRAKGEVIVTRQPRSGIPCQSRQ
jgi:hypothetical protein